MPEQMAIWIDSVPPGRMHFPLVYVSPEALATKNAEYEEAYRLVFEAAATGASTDPRVVWRPSPDHDRDCPFCSGGDQ